MALEGARERGGRSGLPARLAACLIAASILPAAAARAADEPAPVATRESERSVDVEVDGLLAEAETLLLAAHFRTSLGVLEKARTWLDGAPGCGRCSDARVRLEVLAATALVALGDTEAARASMRRALASRPGLSLDESATSPKVVAVLEAARARTPGAGTGP